MNLVGNLVGDYAAVDWNAAQNNPQSAAQYQNIFGNPYAGLMQRMENCFQTKESRAKKYAAEVRARKPEMQVRRAT